MRYANSRNCENLEKYVFNGCGKYDIPRLDPESYEGEHEFISFNYARTAKNRNGKVCHFFIDDYQFQRLWTNIDAYIPMLQEFDYVLTPDFSLYLDYPKAMQIYNHYRKHWIGAYMQMLGIKVIPTIAWSDKESFDWCFDGEPEGGTVAVSGSDGNAFAEKSIETVIPLLCMDILLYSAGKRQSTSWSCYCRIKINRG